MFIAALGRSFANACGWKSGAGCEATTTPAEAPQKPVTAEPVPMAPKKEFPKGGCLRVGRLQ